MRPVALLFAVLTMLMGCVGDPGMPSLPDCSTPRSATDSLLAWQQPGAFDLRKATTCVEPVPGRDIQKLAVQLKQVLDARGLYVPVPTLPDEPDYTDAAGEATVRPLDREFPLVVSRGDDGQWRYTRETMDAVPGWYRRTFSPLVSAALERLPSAFFDQVLGLFLWQYLFGALLGALAWLVGRLVRSLLQRQALAFARRIGIELDRTVYDRTRAPIVWTSVLVVLAAGLPQLQLPIDVSRWLVGLVTVGQRITLTWLAVRLVDVGASFAQRAADRTESKLDDQLVPLLRQAATVVVLTFGGLLVLQALGVDVWKLLAGVSIGSLVFALAAQDTVANVFGSFNVFVDRPFQIGDWIVVGDVEGVVEEVGFRSTRVRTFYNSQVTVPNRTLTNANIDNYGRRARRRVKVVLGLTYDTPPDTLQAYVEGVRAILSAHPHVQKTHEVHFHDFGASSLDILVYYHLVVPDWHTELTTRAQNLLEFLRLAEELGVSFAFPSTSVYVESTPERPLEDRPRRALEELQAVVDAFGPGGRLSRPDGPAFSDAHDADVVAAKGSPGDDG